MYFTNIFLKKWMCRYTCMHVPNTRNKMYMNAHMWGYIDRKYVCIYEYMCESVYVDISAFLHVFSCAVPACICSCFHVGHMCLCECTSICVYIYIWRPKIVIGCFPPPLSTLWTEAVASSWTWSLPCQLVSPHSSLWDSSSLTLTHWDYSQVTVPVWRLHECSPGVRTPFRTFVW